MLRLLLALALTGVLLTATHAPAQDKDAGPPPGFIELFNGKDLSGWKVPEGDNGHWKVDKGVIDYDARSEGKGDKSLWTQKSYKNFVLLVDWRLKTEPGLKHKVAVIGPDGVNKKGADGKDETEEIDDVDSGIYVRGSSKAQLNIWLWSVGSGEVWGYRTDAKMSAEVRKGVTPAKKADRPRGEWNTFEIKMQGDVLNVKLNGQAVLTDAKLPGVPETGPIALQHHGAFKGTGPDATWTSPPSLVQFKNIYIRELE